MKTFAIFITPGGNSSPRCSFSTLSRKRLSSDFFDSSYCLRIASISDIVWSDSSAKLHHCERALAFERLRQARIDVAVQDRLLVVAVLRQALDLLALDRLGALVLVDAVAVEDPDL